MEGERPRSLTLSARTEQPADAGSAAVLRTRPTEDKGMRRFAALRVSDGTRTRDRLDHNQELYQLSYAHRAERSGFDRRSESSTAAQPRISSAGPSERTLR